MRKRTGAAFHSHLRAAYRSGLETAIGAALALAGVAYTYESHKVPYTQPAKARTYTPDFVLPNGIVLETKGLFVAEDRQKHVLVKQQHPDLDVRFIFSNANAKLRKGSPTTYAMWCDKEGFKWAHKKVPEIWLTEPPLQSRKDALTRLIKA
jgi:hypothetical protein